MQKSFLLIALLFVNLCLLNAQGMSLDDSTTTYKNKEGKTLTGEELKELTKGKFNMQTETGQDGKKIVTIIPLSQAKADAQSEMIEKIRRSFLDRPLADFTFKDVNKNRLSKKELNGKVIVVNFWFTACKPCMEEIPLLNEVVASYAGKGVVFIAPGLDDEKMVTKFLTKHPFNYQVVADQNAYADKMKVEVFPTHLITDKKGIIKQVIIGYHADIKEQLGKSIDWLLQ